MILLVTSLEVMLSCGRYCGLIIFSCTGTVHGLGQSNKDSSGSGVLHIQVLID